MRHDRLVPAPASTIRACVRDPCLRARHGGDVRLDDGDGQPPGPGRAGGA